MFTNRYNLWGVCECVEMCTFAFMLESVCVCEEIHRAHIKCRRMSNAPYGDGKKMTKCAKRLHNKTIPLINIQGSVALVWTPTTTTIE